MRDARGSEQNQTDHPTNQPNQVEMFGDPRPLPDEVGPLGRREGGQVYPEDIPSLDVSQDLGRLGPPPGDRRVVKLHKQAPPLRLFAHIHPGNYPDEPRRRELPIFPLLLQLIHRRGPTGPPEHRSRGSLDFRFHLGLDLSLRGNPNFRKFRKLGGLRQCLKFGDPRQFRCLSGPLPSSCMRGGRGGVWSDSLSQPTGFLISL